MSPGGVRIRGARTPDLGVVARLWCEVESEHARLLPGTFRPPSPAAVGRALEKRVRADFTASSLVAELDSAVVGFVSLVLTEAPAEGNFLPMRRVQVEMIAVDASVRRRGVGRALMAAAEAWGREHGADELGLTVWAGNRQAESFYEALGFAPLARALYRRIG